MFICLFPIYLHLPSLRWLCISKEPLHVCFALFILISDAFLVAIGDSGQIPTMQRPLVVPRLMSCANTSSNKTDRHD